MDAMSSNSRKSGRSIDICMELKYTYHSDIYSSTYSDLFFTLPLHFRRKILKEKNTVLKNA